MMGHGITALSDVGRGEPVLASRGLRSHACIQCGGRRLDLPRAVPAGWFGFGKRIAVVVASDTSFLLSLNFSYNPLPLSAHNGL
jgi:hypothetical protein